jgi:hypothetical protein
MKHLAAIILLFAAASAMSHAQTPLAPLEQSHFTAAEADVQKPILIPAATMAILREDADVRDALQSAKLSPQKLPAGWFSASEIHLGPAGERDLLVVGKGPLHGANATTFWVFIPTSTGPELALKTAAHDFYVKSARTKAHRNIEITTRAAAQVTTITFHFDGHRYHTYARGTRNIRQKAR